MINFLNAIIDDCLKCLQIVDNAEQAVIKRGAVGPAEVRKELAPMDAEIKATVDEIGRTIDRIGAEMQARADKNIFTEQPELFQELQTAAELSAIPGQGNDTAAAIVQHLAGDQNAVSQIVNEDRGYLQGYARRYCIDQGAELAKLCATYDAIRPDYMGNHFLFFRLITDCYLFLDKLGQDTGNKQNTIPTTVLMHTMNHLKATVEKLD